MNDTNLPFAPSGFLTGVAGVLDFGGTLSNLNYDTSDEQADRLAIESDWVAVGRDMWAACETIERQLPGADGGHSQEARAEKSRSAE